MSYSHATLVHEKLDEFINQGVIVPVMKPTDLVSSLAYSWMANGLVCMWLHSMDLNLAIKQDHYRNPMVEEMAHELDESTHFTKLDDTSSHLCISLDYEASLLTTFNTPWGLYCFFHLLWGLACAPDIFQCMMDHRHDYCHGVIRIVDDVITHDEDDEEADRCLHKLMEVTCEHGIVFSDGKCAVKEPSMTFFGCVYDKDGPTPDPCKVVAVHDMPLPETPTQL